MIEWAFQFRINKFTMSMSSKQTNKRMDELNQNEEKNISCLSISYDRIARKRKFITII